MVALLQKLKNISNLILRLEGEKQKWCAENQKLDYDILNLILRLEGEKQKWCAENEELKTMLSTTEKVFR